MLKTVYNETLSAPKEQLIYINMTKNLLLSCFDYMQFKEGEMFKCVCLRE